MKKPFKFPIKLKIKENENTFNDIDPLLRSKFIKNFILCAIALAAAFIFGISLKNAQLFIVIAAISLIFIGINMYRIFLTLEGSVWVVKGTFYEQYIPPKKKSFYQRKYIIIMGDDAIDDEDDNGSKVTFYKCYVPNSFNANEGNEITVFAPRTAFYRENNDTLIINSIYCIKNSSTVSNMVMKRAVSSAEEKSKYESDEE